MGRSSVPRCSSSPWGKFSNWALLAGIFNVLNRLGKGSLMRDIQGLFESGRNNWWRSFYTKAIAIVLGLEALAIRHSSVSSIRESLLSGIANHKYDGKLCWHTPILSTVPRPLKDQCIQSFMSGNLIE